MSSTLVPEELSPERVTELWSLLLKGVNDRLSLTDEEIDALFEAQEKLRDLLYRAGDFPRRLREVKSYRARRRELEKLQTEDLQRRLRAIYANRAAYEGSVDHEEISDSFFETPAIDTDLHILDELLKERGVDRW